MNPAVVGLVPIEDAAVLLVKRNRLLQAVNVLVITVGQSPFKAQGATDREAVDHDPPRHGHESLPSRKIIQGFDGFR